MAPNTAPYHSDGDLLIVPQTGTLDIQTEISHLFVRPNGIFESSSCPRGTWYRVDLAETAAEEPSPIRGYILEPYRGHFTLPEVGPVGSNCLANARDFQIPRCSLRTRHGKEEWQAVGSVQQVLRSPLRRDAQLHPLWRRGVGGPLLRPIFSADKRLGREDPSHEIQP